MDNLGQESEVSIIPSLSFHDYDVYYDIGNISNDKNDAQEIALTFERNLRKLNCKLIIELSPDSRMRANQGVGNQRAASLKRFELYADSKLLVRQTQSQLELNFAGIYSALFGAKFISELSVSKFISDFTKVKEQFVNHGKKIWLYEDADSIMHSVTILQTYLTQFPESRMCFTLAAEFINFITGQLLLPLRNLTVINDHTSTKLDMQSYEQVNAFLKEFGIALEHAESVPRNDGEVLPKITGLQWLLRQHGQIRLADSFGSGTTTLLNYLKRISQMTIDSELTDQNDIVLIEEPERNLHPDWQIKFMELILGNLKSQRIIVETHSIYLLRVLQLAVLKKSINPEEITIHEFYRDNDDVVRVSPITIDKNGMLSRDFYGGFNSGLLDLEKELWLRQQGRIKAN
jgi:hypothetical protein